MSIVIPETKTFNRVFEDRADLIRFVEDHDRWETDSNAFILMCRIVPHKRGYKLVSMFFCDKGIAYSGQMGPDCYTYGEVMNDEFCRDN